MTERLYRETYATLARAYLMAMNQPVNFMSSEQACGLLELARLAQLSTGLGYIPLHAAKSELNSDPRAAKDVEQAGVQAVAEAIGAPMPPILPKTVTGKARGVSGGLDRTPPLDNGTIVGGHYQRAMSPVLPADDEQEEAPLARPVEPRSMDMGDRRAMQGSSSS